MALLDEIRTAVRVSPVPQPDSSGLEPDEDGWVPTYDSDYDGELQDLVDAAFADMLMKGIRPVLLDAVSPAPLVKLAVKLYAKAHFGYDNPERGEFVASYERVLIDMKNSSIANVEYWRTDMADCVVSAIGEQVYTGHTVRPVPEVEFDGRELEAGKDFTVWYADNVEVGTATAYIQGTGEFVGLASVPFEIAEA